MMINRDYFKIIKSLIKNRKVSLKKRKRVYQATKFSTFFLLECEYFQKDVFYFKQIIEISKGVTFNV